MRNLFRIIAIGVALTFGATFSWAQQAYIEIGVLPGVSTFRDMATSPLFYKGNTLSYMGAWHLNNKANEKLASLNYTFGKHTNRYNNTNNSAKFYSLELYYSQLYQLNKLSSNKWKTKIGAGVISSLNIRENKALMNNSLGIENISNILFATKASWDISRLDSKSTKRCFSLFINIGVVNLNYRPGYAYNYMPSIGSAYVRSMTDHHLSLNGFRLNSILEYSRSVSNRNIVRVSYIFDAYNAPGKYEPFNYAKHSLKLSFLYKYK